MKKKIQIHTNEKSIATILIPNRVDFVWCPSLLFTSKLELKLTAILLKSKVNMSEYTNQFG